MYIFKNIISAFSMFSAVPMPKIDYRDKNYQYMMAFFPLVGIVLGLLIFALANLCHILKLNNYITSVIITAVPVYFTGGIHLDGFMDCNDAFASHAEKEKMFMIMKDSNVGAFAVLHTAVYFLLYYSIVLSMEKTNESFIFLVFIFFLSRCCSASVTLILRKSKENGLAKSISEMAKRKQNIIILLVQGVLAVIIMFCINIMTSCYIFLGCIFITFYCIFKIQKLFGGITGDLAGWYLCCNELVMLFCMVLSEGGFFI